MAVVVADGEPDARDARLLDGADLLVAADGGAGWLDRHGRRPDVVVGDLDSIDSALVERLAAQGVAIDRHPADKDASDAELAVRRALGAGADEVLILGALAGERLDHALANLLLLVDPVLRRRDVRIVRGGITIRAVHAGDRLELDGGAGDVVTLLPIGGPAEGVRTSGLRYRLDGEPLRMGTSRGLSNVLERAPASVQLQSGTLLVVQIAKGAGS